MLNYLKRAVMSVIQIKRFRVFLKKKKKQIFKYAKYRTNVNTAN
jgi:hypothetical protein